MKCIGCEAEAEQHPMVAVMKDEETGKFVAHPACDRCWKDPSHRKTPIKGHFFEARMSKLAVAMAGSDTIGG